MNKTFIILMWILLSTEFIESKPRYGYEYWSQFVDPSSEERWEGNGFEPYGDCSHIYIGNGNDNHNIVHFNHFGYPNKKQIETETETYPEIDERSGNEKQKHVNRRPYNHHDFGKKPQKPSEISDFGNGNNNKNTFNIHFEKKSK